MTLTDKQYEEMANDYAANPVKASEVTDTIVRRPTPDGIRLLRSKPVLITAIEWKNTQESYDAIVLFTDRALGDGFYQQFLWLKEDDEELFDVLGQKLVLEAIEQGYTAKVYDHLHDTWVNVKTGDYIIQGTRGEFYPCDAGVIAEKYEEIPIRVV